MTSVTRLTCDVTLKTCLHGWFWFSFEADLGLTLPEVQSGGWPKSFDLKALCPVQGLSALPLDQS